MSTDASDWVKAPAFTTDPARAEAVRQQTLADRHNYLERGMQPVQCRSCGTEVLVRKNSFQQTSIQWTTDPRTSCPVFAAGDAAQPQGCPKLRQSIEHAVLEGLLEVENHLPPCA
ncbi:hypothetical protein FOS14_17910 [Skermania sp. ID1734]|uniref:hypothetical protein n=1 Tax=Skermania sp. ID1734 TaxID=2597516 RepID=UPI001180696D|nr:hypothetical protein [Skermania sp. ID1734]TSD95673.1 hypothetical protein FOS14_17910 [Skermania sp. ID1734]